MNYSKYFFFFFFFFFLSYSVFVQEVVACWDIINYAQNELPNWGILKNSEGFVYVDLDDNYIHQLVTFIQEDGFEASPILEVQT